ncbi:MAG: hypothetical protein ACREAB_21575 [Blastocatellia bacterium]
MQRTTEQDERMTRYLLGDLPETEVAAVEQEYFADQEKFEEVWAAENDLVDRYVRGRLSRGERELFERNYLQSPKHRERVAVARKLLEAPLVLDHQDAEGAVAPQAVEPTPSWRSGLMEKLNIPRMPRLLLPATAFLLLFSVLSWLMIERGRLNDELGKTKAQLSEQQRREREVADQLAAEREQSGKLKSELDRLLETIAQRPSQPPARTDRPSILSLFLTPWRGPRAPGGGKLQEITISRETDLVRLRMKIENGDSRRFQAAIRTVEGARVWNQRSLKPGSGAITANVPANKLPLGDYTLTLSATTPTGDTEVINRYSFRVIRK